MHEVDDGVDVGVVLVKPDGNTKAMTVRLRRASLLTFEVGLPIEPGDLFERELRDGELEHYEVEMARYVEEFGTIAAHYECRIRRVLVGVFTRPKLRPPSTFSSAG